MHETPQQLSIMSPEEEAAWDDLEKRLKLEEEAKERREKAVKTLNAGKKANEAEDIR